MSNLQKYIQAGERVLLVGPPGIAKTARIEGAAKACNRKLVVMRASLSERVDFGGALVPDFASGITRALPLEQLAELRTTKEPTLLFLDDLGQAPVDVQAALMRLFDGGALSDQVLIAGASCCCTKPCTVRTSTCGACRRRSAATSRETTPSI